MATRFQPARGSAVMGAIARGPTGTAATVAVGTVTTLAAGATATVSNSGTSAAATFNFGIPRGAEAGIKWLYDSSTSMADPGSGDMRFNNATLSSVTAIAVSATGSGSDVSDFVASWDNSTSSTPAYIMIREEAGSVAAIFSLSAVTDNTAWLQLTVAYVSGSLSLTAADPLYVVPMLVGNAGTDGEMAGPGVSVDGEIALYDGIGGATLKRASITGVLKAASGVLAAAVSGTDYAPATSGTAILKGNGSGGFSSASAGTDYQGVDSTLTALAAYNTNGLLTQTAADTFTGRTITGTSNEITVSNGDGVSGNPTLSLSATANPVGKHTIWVPASAMLSATTSGPASAQFESGTNDRNFKVLDFDASADEHAHFNVAFPKGWNEGTVTFQAFWMSSATDTDGVAWALEGYAISDNESTDASWGTAVVVTDDAQSNASELYVTSESAAVTIGGTPAEGDVCYFRIFRDVSDANDDMTEDARLIGVKIHYTINAATDA